MLPLTLKYRSQDFDSLEGQPLTRQVLKAAAKVGKLSHAYLLTGPRGTGKTSTARIIAKAINCLNLKEDGNPCNECAICVQVRQGNLLDLIEIDAASHTGVDNIRELIDKARFLPSVARKKVYIVDEVHMLSKPAFNALLKTLEEPPEHVHFILATTEFDRVPDTIVSRCQTFRFAPIPHGDIVKRLSHVCEQEGLRYEQEALSLIAKHASGGLRDALTTLEKAIHNEAVELEHVRSLLGDGSNEAFDRLYAAVTERNAPQVLSELSAIQATTPDPAGLERSWLRYLQGLLHQAVRAGSPAERILYLLDQCQSTFDTFQGSTIAGLGLEVALLKACGEGTPRPSVIAPATPIPVVATPASNPSPLSPSPTPIPTPPSRLVSASTPESIPPSSNPPLPPFDLQAVRSGWTGFAMTLPSVIKPLVSTSEPTTLEGATLTIEVGSRSYLERLSERKTRSVLDEAFRNFFGSEPAFRFVLKEVPAQLSPSSTDAIDDAMEVFS